MLVYNITFSVAEDTAEEWVKWARKVFLPAYEATGYFDQARLFQIMHGAHNGQVSYCMHLEVASKKLLAQFYQLHQEPLNDLLKTQFGEKCLTFDTILEPIV